IPSRARDRALGAWITLITEKSRNASVRSFTQFRMTACKRRPQRYPRTLDKETMDPARPNDPDPSDPFNPERADHAILETIELATEGEDCDECVRKLRAPLMKIKGVRNVKVDLPHERVIVTFDARKTHAPDLHDAILKR